MAAALSGQKRESWIHSTEAERLGVEYAKLVMEMHDAARRQSVRFTVVLIPEASMADGAFRRFWSGMPEFWEQLRGNHWVQQALARELKGRVAVVDLAEFPETLQDAYWPLDGHFNEKGQAAVAELLVQHLTRDGVDR